MCETRDLGIKWPHWYTLIPEGDRRVDMRHVCSKDVKKMLVQQARSDYGSKARTRSIEGGYLAGTGSGLVAQEK